MKKSRPLNDKKKQTVSEHRLRKLECVLGEKRTELLSLHYAMHGLAKRIHSLEISEYCEVCLEPKVFITTDHCRLINFRLLRTRGSIHRGNAIAPS